jgi:hypothetical protein
MNTKKASLLEAISAKVTYVGFVITMDVKMLFQILLRAEVLEADVALEEAYSHVKNLRMSSEVEPTTISLPTVFEWT